MLGLRDCFDEALPDIEAETAGKCILAETWNSIQGAMEIIYSCRQAKSIKLVINCQMDSVLHAETGYGRTNPTFRQQSEYLNRLIDKNKDSLIKKYSLMAIACLDKLKNFEVYLNITDSIGTDTILAQGTSTITVFTGVILSSSSGTISVYNGNDEATNIIYNKLSLKLKCSGRNMVEAFKNGVSSTVRFSGRTSEILKKAYSELYKNFLYDSKLIPEGSNIIEFQFQLDGVLELLEILSKYNLAYLADSVGLGKTMTILKLLSMVGYRAIIVCPNDFVKFHWETQAHEIGIENQIITSINSYKGIQNLTGIPYREYDIVIFDEAHHFRNAKTLRYKYALEVCAGKPVILVGATPINNSLEDITSQIMLGLNPSRAYDFGVGPIGEYLEYLKKKSNASKDSIDNFKQARREAGEDLRNKIISRLMVRRTRMDIVKYYESDIGTGKLRFPEIKAPINIEIHYDNYLVSSILDILAGYNAMYPLTWAFYNRDKYGLGVEKYVESVENLDEASIIDDDNESLISKDNSYNKPIMAGLSRIRLIKLLDSSPMAFVGSIKAYYDKLQDEYKKYKDTHPEYSSDLMCDMKTIYYILMLMKNNRGQFDKKVENLSELLDKEHSSEKIVIFTEYRMTAHWIEEYLNNQGRKCLAVTGEVGTSDRKSLIGAINKNFGTLGDSNDYDTLIATNILSEGVNLNRVSVIVNFDIPWNPMVIEQRVGRLNRLDSVVDTISVYNFFPCDELDTGICSEYNIVSKYELACSAIGMDCDCLGKTNTINIVEMSGKLGTTPLFIAEAREICSKNLENLKETQSNVTIAFLRNEAIRDIYAYFVFNCGNTLVVVRHSKSGFEFTNGDEVISSIKQASNSDKNNITDFEIAELEESMRFTSKRYIVNPKLGAGQISLIKVCERGLEIFSGIGGSDEVNYSNIVELMSSKSNNYIKRKSTENDTLSNAKSAILSHIISEQLAKIYYHRYKSLMPETGISASNSIHILSDVLSRWENTGIVSSGEARLELKMFISFTK